MHHVFSLLELSHGLGPVSHRSVVPRRGPRASGARPRNLCVAVRFASCFTVRFACGTALSAVGLRCVQRAPGLVRVRVTWAGGGSTGLCGVAQLRLRAFLGTHLGRPPATRQGHPAWLGGVRRCQVGPLATPRGHPAWLGYWGLIRDSPFAIRWSVGGRGGSVGRGPRRNPGRWRLLRSRTLWRAGRPPGARSRAPARR